MKVWNHLSSVMSAARLSHTIRLVVVGLGLLVFVISLVLGVSLFNRDVAQAVQSASQSGVDTLTSVYGSVSALFVAETALDDESQHPAGRALAKACVDPYKLNGHLKLRSNYHYSNWLPFYDNFFNLTDPAEAAYPPPDPSASIELDHDAPDAEINKQAPHLWMQDVIDYVALFNKNDEADGKLTEDERVKLRKYASRVDFVVNKRVLMIADSVDRYMIIYFCEEVGAKATIGHPRHTTSFCHVPQLNFTIFHWHLASLYTTSPKWWWQPTMKVVPFEERFEAIYKNSLPHVIGMNGRSPDLVLFQTGLWDQVTFIKRVEADKAPQNLNTVMRLMNWDELRFYGARWKHLVAFLRTTFGEDVRLMHRSLSLHKESDDRELMVYDMDRVARYYASKLGTEVFEWGRLSEGFSSELRDMVHYQKGPMSWLYHNMLLSYLFRASGGIENQGAVYRWPRYYARDMEILGKDPNSDPWLQCHDKFLDNLPR